MQRSNKQLEMHGPRTEYALWNFSRFSSAWPN